MLKCPPNKQPFSPTTLSLHFVGIWEYFRLSWDYFIVRSSFSFSKVKGSQVMVSISCSLWPACACLVLIVFPLCFMLVPCWLHYIRSNHSLTSLFFFGFIVFRARLVLFPLSWEEICITGLGETDSRAIHFLPILFLAAQA